MKTTNLLSKKLITTAAMAVMGVSSLFAQTNIGNSCGCPDVADRDIVLMSTLTTGGNLNDTTTILSCDKLWILDQKVYVPAFKTLVIQPGTVIKGRAGGVNNANALIVERDGDIIAAGTSDCPIIFTAETDPLDGSFGITNRGLWGGVVILGKATNNLIGTNVYGIDGVDGVGFVEGFISAESRNLYGMPIGQTDDNDNSGIVSYVSIRHAGESVGLDNELNGLTLASVGRGTTINHIEIISNFDDGIEFFGGTVNVKYITCMFNSDDNFDYDLGWTGNAQFLFVLQNATTGDNGFEMDGDDDKTNPSLLSHPIIYNATVIGGELTQSDAALEAKELTEGEIYNSIFCNFKFGLNLIQALGSRTGTIESYHNWVNGDFIVNNCTFVGVTNPIAIANATTALIASDNTKFTTDGNTSVASVSGIDFSFGIDAATNAVSDIFAAVPTSAIASTVTAPATGFFTPVNYRGAFATGEKNWLSDWSYAQVLSVTTGLVSNPTDINNDGVTNVTDLLQVIGKYNQINN